MGDVLIPILDEQDGLGAWGTVAVYSGESVHVGLYVLPGNTRALADLVISFKAGRGPPTSHD